MVAPAVKIDIIDLVGKGQYSGKITWLREYIQNAVDAGSSDFIEISLNDADLTITDHGKGMTEDELNLQAFSIGDSKKSPQEIGELGIGMYAGTGICDKMVLVTKTKYRDNAVEAQLDMVLYRNLIREDPMPTFEDGILKILKISTVQSPIEDTESFTVIRFENINRETLSELKKEALTDFILKTVDVPIGDNFPKKTEINEFLNDDAREIKVFLNYNGEIIEPKKFHFQGIEFSDTVLKEEILSKEGRLIGKIWGAYNKEGEAFSGSGVVVKRKGLTIGDESYVVSHFNSKPLPRFVGEIVVLDDKIEINTSRDWFVSSQNLDTFVEEAHKVLNKFYDVANFDSAIGKRILNLANGIIKQKELESESKKNKNFGDKMKAMEKIQDDQNKLKNKIKKAGEFQTKFDNGKIADNDQYNKLKMELVQRVITNPGVDSIIKSTPTQPVTKNRKNPWPKIVNTFIESNIIDQSLAEKLYEKNDVKDVANNLFTYIEQKLKKLLGKDEQQYLLWKDMVNEFTNTYNPPDLKGFDRSRYIQAFKGIMLGMYTIIRDPSGHTFMEDMNNPRNILEILLIGDFMVRWVDQWERKPS